MSFIDIALPLAQRGFRVFPLIPKTKRPVKMAEGDHFDAATTDEEQLRMWDQQQPDANVAMSPDEIFCFLETDDAVSLHEACADLPFQVWNTTTVGARANRLYYIFRQTARTKRAGNMTATREGLDNLFEFKQHRVYCTGPGSIHPKTGTTYEATWEDIPAMPDVLLARLCELYGKPKALDAAPMSDDTKIELDKLDGFLLAYDVPTVGDWFQKGAQWYRPIECPWADQHENDSAASSTCIVYTEGKGYGFNCKHRCSSKGWKEFRAEMERRHGVKFYFKGEPSPSVTIGKKPTPTAVQVQAEKRQQFTDSVEAWTKDVGVPAADWRSFYHSFDEMENAPELTFLIDGLLHIESITGLAAPAGHRKSIIALNIAHSLCTGEPLFGKFAVTEQPRHVLYLCPEMGMRSFRKRVRAIGLMPYVGKTFFCRTMNREDPRHLDDLTPEEVNGAVVIVDTAARFIKGDESNVEDMKVFAQSLFRLAPHAGQPGAAAVVVIYHSGKGHKDFTELTLENVLRGSSELGAALTCCWGTKLQQTDDPAEKLFELPNYLKCVKPRDFDDEPPAFEVRTDPNCHMSYVENDGVVMLKVRSKGNVGNKDGKDEAAVAIIQANMDKSGTQLSALLKEHDIKRSASWCNLRKAELKGTGTNHTAS